MTGAMAGLPSEHSETDGGLGELQHRGEIRVTRIGDSDDVGRYTEMAGDARSPEPQDRGQTSRLRFRWTRTDDRVTCQA
jgi:hypothetical protein